jgi:hypothetical protein
MPAKHAPGTDLTVFLQVPAGKGLKGKGEIF